MRLLYQIEQEYFNALNDANITGEQGCTLGEFLDLGFNNTTLLNPNEEDTDAYDIGDLFIDVNGEYSIEGLTDEMLDCEVELSSTYEDWDGYTCANICLSNEEDWKYFKDLGGK